MAAALVALPLTPATYASELTVSPPGRYLALNGKPFFWLGDTVWLLAQVPSRDELELALRMRASSGCSRPTTKSVMMRNIFVSTMTRCSTTMKGDQ